MRRTLIALTCLGIIAIAPAFAAIPATMVWECRATGAYDNGGGFDSAVGGGVDHSQADAAALALEDLYFTSGTTLKSDGGGFDADMVGNVVYIHAGTHFTVGWYEVMTRVSTNEVTLDRAPASEDTTDHKNGHGKLGGGIALGNTAIDNELFLAVVAGNTIYVTGTWTLSENVNAAAADGTNIAPICVVGYNASRSATPYLTDRPAWTTGAFFFLPGDYWHISNIDATGSGSAGVLACTQQSNIVYNCKVLNNSGTASRVALSTSNNAIVSHCDISSTNGTAVSVGAAALRLVYSYIHDSPVGLTAGGQLVVVGNVFYNVAAPLSQGTSSLLCLIGNTFNTGTTGIAGNVADVCAMNNIVDNFSTAEVAWTTNYVGWWAYNSWGEASPTLTNISTALGPGNLSSDPGLVNPAGGDFTVPIGSAALDAGGQVDTNLGLVGDYKHNIGADQADHAATTTLLLTTE